MASWSSLAVGLLLLPAVLVPAGSGGNDEHLPAFHAVDLADLRQGSVIQMGNPVGGECMVNYAIKVGGVPADSREARLVYSAEIRPDCTVVYSGATESADVQPPNAPGTQQNRDWVRQSTWTGGSNQYSYVSGIMYYWNEGNPPYVDERAVDCSPGPGYQLSQGSCYVEQVTNQGDPVENIPKGWFYKPVLWWTEYEHGLGVILYGPKYGAPYCWPYVTGSYQTPHSWSACTYQYDSF